MMPSQPNGQQPSGQADGFANKPAEHADANRSEQHHNDEIIGTVHKTILLLWSNLRLVTIRFESLGNLFRFLPVLFRAYAHAVQGATSSGVRQSEGTEALRLQFGNEFIGLLPRAEAADLHYPTRQTDHRCGSCGLDWRRSGRDCRCFHGRRTHQRWRGSGLVSRRGRCGGRHTRRRRQGQRFRRHHGFNRYRVGLEFIGSHRLLFGRERLTERKLMGAQWHPTVVARRLQRYYFTATRKEPRQQSPPEWWHRSVVV